MPMVAAAVAAPIVGGIIGSMSAKKSRKAAAAAAAAAYAELEKIGMPPDLSKEIIMQQFSSQGILDPEMEQEISMQASRLAEVKEDPSLRNAQLDVLSTLGGVSRGGLRAEDRAAYNQLRASVQQDQEAKRQQLMQSMQAKGMGGSGAELMAQLQSQQASADQASTGADNLAAESSRAAKEALMQRANLAGSMRTQDLGVEEMRARAIDDRNRFLYENSVARQRSNVGAQNEAQGANLANKQRLSELNVAQANQESLRQNQAKRDYFNDQLGLASAKAAALNNQASSYTAQGQQKSDMWSGLGSAIGQGAAAYANRKTPAVTADSNVQGSGYDFVNPNKTRQA